MHIPLHHIRNHYDRLSVLYRAFWGEHIHHGYWEDHEPTAVAQVKLIEKLAEKAEISRRARILDIGCGVGGSSLWLAEHYEARVIGLTLSEVQVKIARKKTGNSGLQSRVSFLQADANHLPFAGPHFDVVWIIECSEHVENKPAFIVDCSRVLKSGGRLAVCAWLKAEGLSAEEEKNFIDPVCSGFLCPSLERLSDYLRWMREVGLTIRFALDITRRVEKTWSLCAAIARRLEIRRLLQFSDEATVRFVNAFGAIQRAYARDKMVYGMIVAQKE